MYINNMFNNINILFLIWYLNKWYHKEEKNEVYIAYICLHLIRNIANLTKYSIADSDCVLFVIIRILIK